MAFDLATWKKQAAERLRGFKREAESRAPSSVYATLCAMSIWPAIQAAQSGEAGAAVLASLHVAANVGANLVANNFQKWKDESEAAKALEAEARSDAKTREALDKILAAFEAPREAQTSLSEADKKWFADTLHKDIKTLGSKLNVTINKGGAYVAGDVSAQGDFVMRDKVIYNYYTRPSGEQGLTEDEFRRVLADYSRHVFNAFGAARLFGDSPKSKTRRDLAKVFVPVTLRRFDPPSRKEVEAAEQELTNGGKNDHARQMAILIAQDRKRGEGDIVSVKDLLTVKDRIAIVGGAGSGKSTLLAYYAALLCSGEPLPFALPKRRAALVPLIVPFRAYRIYVDECRSDRGLIVRDKLAGTLAGFIPWWQKRRSGLLDASEDFFHRLLLGGGCLLMLDGLDEVVNRDERAKVKGQVEQLIHEQYPGNVVIVTAREAGFRDDTVFSDEFLRLDVQPQDDAQIETLIANWCRELYPADVATQTRKLMDAIQDINARRADKALSPFVSSPLMTTMVVSVKESETELPRERAKLYEACVKVILQAQHVPDDPDDTRAPLRDWGGPWERQRDWLSRLALAMHSGGKAGAFITQEGLESILKMTIPPESLSLFIEAVRNRGGLLEERAELFQFAHLTFQEFLTARWLAKERNEGLPVLQDHLTDPWWREVGLLTYGFAQIDYAKHASVYLDWLSNQAGETKLAGLELAGAALLELERPDPVSRAAQAKRLCKALTDRTLMAPGAVRGRAGRVLNELGDPRPGMLTVDDMPMCYVPPGEFIMGGDRYNDERPEHPQKVKDGFWISQYPVTNAHYDQFVGEEGYARTEFWADAIAAKRWEAGKFRGWQGEWRSAPRPYVAPFTLANHPVIGVSWYEALAFTRWLGQRLQRKCALPSEAQWEYVARGPRYAPKAITPLVRTAKTLGEDTEQAMLDFASEMGRSKSTAENRRGYPWGEVADPTKMNFDQTGIGSTSAVGAFPAGVSLLGCEDMSGNVWEWTMTKKTDDYRDYDKKVDSRPDGSEAARVLRGGAFNHAGYIARCAYRYGNSPNYANDFVGFRVVASPIPL